MNLSSSEWRDPSCEGDGEKTQTVTFSLSRVSREGLQSIHSDSWSMDFISFVQIMITDEGIRSLWLTSWLGNKVIEIFKLDRACSGDLFNEKEKEKKY